MKRILVIDDDDMARNTARDVLKTAGYDVGSLECAKEALLLLEKEKFDLILVDYQMPGMDGLEFCRALRSRGDATRLALLTASGYSRDMDSEVASLGAEFIRKPFMASELISRVKRMLG